MRKTAFYISLFMFSIMGVLTAISAVYPADGLHLGKLSLRFPTLTEMLPEKPSVEQPAAPVVSPEELLLQREKEMLLQQEHNLINFFRDNQAAIRFPRALDDTTSIGDSTYFDAFFAALENAANVPVNVVHYGDSQIEEDRISKVLRQSWQAEFTGGGVGLVPAYQSVQTLTVKQTMSYKPVRSIVYNTAYKKKKDKQYGPTGQMAWIDSTYTISVSPRDNKTGKYSAHYFSQLTLLSSGESGLKATILDKRYAIPNNGTTLQMTTFDLPDSTTSASIRLSGRGNIYGVRLSNPTGVNVDNIPMRGCSGTIFTRMDDNQLSSYFEQTNTRLIILQYGGNNMPHLRGSEGVDRYMRLLRRQIEYMKRQAPNAAFLFIGPSDMTTRKNGTKMTYPILPEVNDKLSAMARDAGIAYWSMYDAMGGHNSMQQWVASGLAGKDYIHFTRRGADEMGKILYDELMTAYRYYQWRNNNRAEPEKPSIFMGTEEELYPEMNLEIEFETSDELINATRYMLHTL